MVARLTQIKSKIPVYRVVFSDLVAVAGIAVELVGVKDKLVTLRYIQLSKPSAALEPYILNKSSTVSLLGASTSPTPLPLRTSYPAALAVVKLFTTAPTSGVVIDQLHEIDIASSDVMNEGYIDNNGQGIVKLETAAETLTIVVATSVTLNGYIEWQEEP